MLNDFYRYLCLMSFLVIVESLKVKSQNWPISNVVEVLLTQVFPSES